MRRTFGRGSVAVAQRGPKVGVLLAGAFLLAAMAGCLSGSDAPRDDLQLSTVEARKATPAGTPKAATGGFSDTSVFPGSYRMKGPYSLVLTAGPYAIGPESVQTIGSGQSATQVGYVLPVAPPGTRFPVIVQASVYYGPLKAGSLRDSYNSNPVHSVNFLLDNYVPHGYAVVLIPARGAAGNGGCYEWWSHPERQDLRAAIDWVKQQPWSDGNLGLIGFSLGGGSAWIAAGFGDPAIKTIVPVASETDLYSWFVRNGTPTIIGAPLGTPAFWFQYSILPFSLAAKPLPARDPSRIPDGAACPGMADAFEASAYMTTTGMPDDPRGYIRTRDLRPAVEANYRGSIFLVTGLHDWLAHPHLVYPWVNTLEERGVVVKHLIGQWRHRMPDDPSEGAYFQPTLRPDFAEILLHWFDYWLKGKKDVDLGPRVQVADSSLGWRDEKAWPPQSQARTLYLGANERLQASPAADGSVVIGPDPRRAIIREESSGQPRQNCPACQYFVTDPLPEGLRFAGLPRLHVTATPLGTGGYVTAYLYALEGTTYKRLGWATMDLRFARGPSTMPLVPAQSVTADIEFEPLDAAVAPNARLVLELFQGGYGEDFTHFPGRALAPAAYYRSSLPTNPVRVELGGQDTYLVLPETVKKPKTFEAPKPIEGG